MEYRKGVIYKKVSERLKNIFEYIQGNYNITLIEWNHDRNYVHILLKAKQATALSKFISSYKSEYSGLIKKGFLEIR